MSVVERLPAAAPEQSVPSAAELVARARTLAPKLRERAVKAERDRTRGQRCECRPIIQVDIGERRPFFVVAIQIGR